MIKRLMTTTFLALMLAFVLPACSNPVCTACKESCDSTFPDNAAEAEKCKVACDESESCS